ncbi:hypothetical protein NX722_06305 [Endozoicomonas gorgoniicola]|uniref:Uncharacterized protein n=1 Tax=Endozoicomonas gorgoniicola TaxID=1234144 RepID=A0ABT3MSB5_9GAMM|nr:hypothetical protein [Endozoicomonas gorgoniicola]MCW7552266.1 hypothetical protein [Endozoicomonas gorgoniicola]
MWLFPLAKSTRQFLSGASSWSSTPENSQYASPLKSSTTGDWQRAFWWTVLIVKVTLEDLLFRVPATLNIVASITDSRFQWHVDGTDNLHEPTALTVGDHENKKIIKVTNVGMFTGDNNSKFAKAKIWHEMNALPDSYKPVTNNIIKLYMLRALSPDIS